MISFILSIGLAIVYILQERTNAKLSEPVIMNTEHGDFILHLRVENTEEGFQVLRSLEYTGSDPVMIEHRTPLIAVSIDHTRHAYTGSPVRRVLEPGDIYLSEQPLIFTFRDKGKYVLYAQCQFRMNEEEMNIKLEKDLQFE